MTTKVIVNPKTGMMETVEVWEVDAEYAVRKLRKEVQDMVAGNVQFHVDTLGPDKPKTEAEPSEDPDDNPMNYMYGGYP